MNSYQSKKPEWIPPLKKMYKPRHKSTYGMTQDQLIEYKLEQCIENHEQSRKSLKYYEKWPTIHSVRMYRQSLATSKPFKNPKAKKYTTESWGSPRPPYLWPPKTPPALFPYPITHSKDLRSFTLFSILPTEIRLLIWEFAIRAPRFLELQIIEIKIDRYPTSILNNQTQGALFLACRESRDVALSIASQSPPPSILKVHQTRMQYQNPDDRYGNSTRKPYNCVLRFRPDRDTIFLRSLPETYFNPTRSWPLIGQSSIQHLAVPLHGDILIRKLNWDNIITSLPVLRTLTFLIGSTEKSWRGDESIELRDLEQWYIDGRNRRVVGWGLKTDIDVADIPRFLMERDHVWGNVDVRIYEEFSPKRIINVRVVAWKRGGV